MRVLVTGADGQLGTDLLQILHDPQVIALTHRDIEVSNMSSVRQAISTHKPEVVINTAAYVNVDDCETNPDTAFLVNALGTRNLASVSSEFGVKLVHISTDYVFAGKAEHQAAPYTEFEAPAPLNIYGRSKLAGEDFVRHLCQRYFIVRTSGLFGVAGSRSKRGNFVETVLRIAQERNELRVVDDQVVSPTYSRDLAGKIAQLLTSQYYGTFHVVNNGSCSWYEFAREILRLTGKKSPVIPVTSDLYPQKARRPRFSALDNYHLRLLGMDDMRSWQDALRDYMHEKGHLQ